MSAFGGKADVNHCVGECPLLAISGHWWANENGGPREPDRTPHLHNHARADVSGCEDTVYHPSMTTLTWFTAALDALLDAEALANLMRRRWREIAKH